MATGQHSDEPYEPGSYSYGLEYEPDPYADPPEPEPPHDPVDDPAGDPVEEFYEALIRNGTIDPHTADKPRRNTTEEN